MSAHKIALVTKCDESGCPRSATWIVRNTFNSEMGRYCTRHADAMVRELRSREASR